MPKRYEQILAQMIAKVVARGGLTDITDASAFKHILAAAARQDDEQYYQMTLLLQLFSIDSAVGDDLDARAAEIQPGDLTRYVAQRATGTVVFSRSGTSGTTAIPINTKVKTVGGLVFTTTAAGSITPTSPEQITGHGVGRDSGTVPVLADLPGAAGNVAAYTITKFEVKPAGVGEVTNIVGCLNGSDKELDDSFRARLKAYIRSLSRSTPEAIETNVLGQALATGETVRFAKVWEDPVNRGSVWLYIDDGTGQAETTELVTGEVVTEGLAGPPPDTAVGGETRLFLDNIAVKDSVAFTLTSSIRGALVAGTDYDLVAPWGLLLFDPALVTGESITATYTRYTGLLELIQRVVDGDPLNRSVYPGLRAAGVLVRVAVPQVLIQNVQAVLTVMEGYDNTAVITAVKSALKNYINGLGISGDVIRNELIAVIMGVPGIYNCILTTPATDITMLDDQLARTTDSNLLIT
jgi:uncharacterized phage protein gp47/JayE